MSYSCEISFKEIAGNDVYSFLQEFKKKIMENMKEIAKNNFSYSPIMRSLPIRAETVNITPELREATETWAKNSVFKYRFFYNSKLQLLGIYGVDNSVKDLFDCTIFFQNASDQDYDYEEWSGVKYFEEVVEKWKNATKDIVVAEFEKQIGTEWADEDEDEEYWKKNFVYGEIWDNFKDTLFDDSSVLHLSIFGSFDTFEIKGFAHLVEHHVKEWVDSFNKNKEKKEEKDRTGPDNAHD